MGGDVITKDVSVYVIGQKKMKTRKMNKALYKVKPVSNRGKHG